MNVRINRDSDEVYESGTIMSVEELKNDFIESSLSENKEGYECAEWLKNTDDETAVDFISNAWDLDTTLV